MKTYYYFYY